MKRFGMHVLLTGMLVASFSQLSLGPLPPGPLLLAQETFRLVSAQVVTKSEGPSSLKLTANGPIAFSALPPAEGQLAASNEVRARLHGVVPGDLNSSGLTPYVVVTQADGQDTILTVTAPSNLKIELRAAMKSNELDVVASVMQP